MHYHAIVLVERGSDVLARVQTILAPYSTVDETFFVVTDEVCCGPKSDSRYRCPCQKWGGFEASNPQGLWDFFIIGGHFRGIFRGMRLTEEDVDRLGSQILYEHDLAGSVTPVASFPLSSDDIHDLVEPTGEWHAREHWDGERWVQNAAWPAEVAEVLSGYSDHLAVSVDYHQ